MSTDAARTRGIRWPGPALRSSILLAVGAILAFVIAPSLGGYQQDLLTTLLLYVAGATAWNLVGGMGGQFSLAHSVFIGAGSYTAVIVLRDIAVSPEIALGIATAGGAAIALVISVILFRLRGAYFTIGSLGLGLSVLAWMTIWEFTGATRGVNAPISLVPLPQTILLYATVTAVVALAASIALYHSRFGLRLRAVRDDEEVADSLGVSPFFTKTTVMVISGGLTGLVGALLAYQRISVEPFSAFSLDWTISFIVMSIIGGLGTVWGPALGAVLIYYGLTVQLQAFPTASTIVSGVLMILLIKFLPFGLLGGVQALVSRWRPRQPRDVQVAPTSMERV